MRSILNIADFFIGQRTLAALDGENKARLRTIALFLFFGALAVVPMAVYSLIIGDSTFACFYTIGAIAAIGELMLLSRVSPRVSKHLFASFTPVFGLLNIVFTGTFVVTAMLCIPYLTLSVYLFRASRVRFFYMGYYGLTCLFAVLLSEVTIPLIEISNPVMINRVAFGVSFILQAGFQSLYISEIHSREKQLRTSGEQLSYAQQQASIGSFFVSLRTGKNSFSDELLRIFPTMIASDGMLGLLAQLPPNVGWELSKFSTRGFVHDILSLQFRTGHGNCRWLQLKAEFQTNSTGKITAMYGTLQDITEITEVRNAMQQSEQKFKAMFQQSPAALFIFKDHKVTDCNPEAIKLLCAEGAEELVGTCLSDWSPEFQPDGTSSLLASSNLELDSAGPAQSKFKWTLLSYQQQEIPAEISVNQLKLEDSTVSFLRIIDLRERIAHEAQIKELLHSLQQQNEILEEKVRARTESLQTSNLELQRSNKDLEQFAYAASHDLQEPLRMVGSFVQLLNMEYKDQLDKTASEYIDFAVDGVKRMSGLVKALLEFSRVGRSEVELSKCNVQEIVQGQVSNLSKLIEERGASVRFTSLPEQVLAEKFMLGQLFQNLISNGIKFNKSEAPTVSISCKQVDANWEFTVVDNGIGIASGHEEAVFQIFHRLHPKEEFQGTGIGLAMCRKVVELHGGSIWYDSEPGKGTSFHFTILNHLEKDKSCKIAQAASQFS